MLTACDQNVFASLGFMLPFVRVNVSPSLLSPLPGFGVTFCSISVPFGSVDEHRSGKIGSAELPKG